MGLRSTFIGLATSHEDLAARVHAKDQGKVAAISKYGELNLTNILDGLSLMCKYGGWGEYHETESIHGRRVITLMHNLGQNGATSEHSVVIDI